MYLAVPLGILLLFTIPQVDRPLIVDELDFAKAALAVEETGRPSYYVGEGMKLATFLVHPPLFLYTLALLFKLGLPERLVRVFPLFFVAATVFIIPKISNLGENRNRGRIALLACFIYVLNPLTIQSALLLDIDNSILTFLLTLFLYVYLKYQDNLDLSKTLGMSLFFGLMLWAKFTTPLLLIFSIFLFHVIVGESRRGASLSATLLLPSVLLFSLGWGIYVRALGVSYLVPFRHNIGYVVSYSSMGLERYLLLGVLHAGLKVHIFWLTPAFFALFALTLYSRARGYFSVRKVRPWDLLFVYSTIVFTFYIFVGQSPWKFPKYITPVLPVASILVAEYVAALEWPMKKKEVWMYLFVLAVPIAYHCLFFPSPLMPPHSALEAARSSLLFLLPLAPGFLLLLLVQRNEKETKTILVSSLFLSFLSTALYINYVNLSAPYSTIDNYGEGGFAQSISYVREHTAPEDILLSHGDMAYAVGRRYYESGGDLDSLDCASALRNRSISYVILRGDWDMKYHPVLFECLRKNYKEVNFGNFYIYDVKKD